MALPCGTTGSLSPTFVPARLVGLAVKLPSAITLFRMISNHSEGTFERLRYSLGGDRPSQTAHQTLSPGIHFRGLETRCTKGSIPTAAPAILAYHLLRVLPILYILHPVPISSCSKAPWGLFV